MSKNIDELYNEYFGLNNSKNKTSNNDINHEIIELKKNVKLLNQKISKQSNNHKLKSIIAYIKSIRKYLKKNDHKFDNLENKVIELENLINNNQNNNIELINENVKKEEIKLSFDNQKFYNYQTLIKKNSIILKSNILSNFQIISLEGILSINSDLLKNKEVIGSIKIVNLDTNHIYHGIVKSSDTNIEYILSNRPLIPIHVQFNANILIEINIY